MRSVAVILLGIALSTGVAQAAQQGPASCKDFAWDVHQERALFAGAPQTMQAGSAPAATPPIQTDHFYALQLTSQPQVHFEMAPGKTMLTDGDYAGIVKFTVAQSGSYRVSLDRNFWIDVIADGKLLPTQDFQGQRGCSGPRKIVEFVLPANQELWLQFSGANAPQVHMSITRAPPAAPRSP